ncbi:HAMP domain-containing sensor histidine kinase [Aeromicrobium sp. NPDC092404]|uniref:sensor histidine kinase n=1 Tax=Aeromicrobium sp. NPDC092404 TaxID=3154976 RepID=UPI00344A240A
MVLAFVSITVAVLVVAWASVALDQAADSFVPVLLLGAVALAGATIAGLRFADRLSQPFRELSAVAVDIGEGRFDVQVPHYAVPEAEDLGRALREAAARLDGLVSREQAVAVAASHELRTPITALRLSLEDLALWQQTPPDVAEEIARSISELDRLSDAVTSLLDRNDSARDTGVVDLAELAAQAVARWRTQSNREITLDAPGPMLVLAAKPAVDQVLDAMLAHTNARASGGISVDAVRLGTTVRVRVCLDEPSVLPSGVIHGTTPASGTDDDPALAAAGAVAEAMGGRLGVEDSTGTCLVLVVPVAPELSAT